MKKLVAVGLGLVAVYSLYAFEIYAHCKQIRKQLNQGTVAYEQSQVRDCAGFIEEAEVESCINQVMTSVSRIELFNGAVLIQEGCNL